MALSTNSTDTYAVMVENLRKGLGGDASLDFLLDFERVKTWLETNPTKKTKKPLSPNSLKTYYCAIKNAMKGNAKFDGVVPMYDKELAKFVAEFKAKQDDQTLTEDEKRKWVCWECVIEVREKLLEEFNDDPNWEIFQDYLILCLYSYEPPERLDYAPMRFVSEAPADSIENFCVMKDDKATFILNAYKTAKKYGTMTYDASPELFAVLKQWRKMNPTEWFLVKGKEKRSMTSQELGLAIKDIFTRLTGTGATLNILRHSYRTHLHEGEPSLEEQKEIARRMGHSVLMGQRYRRIDAEQKSKSKD
jgi:hypothetical protein